MKILFLTLTYPDINTSSNLYSDLAHEFAEHNHDIYVVTPQHLYKKTNINNEGKVNVLRVKAFQLFNVNPIKKGLANIILPFQFKKAIKKYFNKSNFDLLISPTPPITLTKVIKWIKKKDNAKSYLILRDIFPQNAKDLGLIRNPLLFWYFRQQEKKLYKLSDYIGCMSDANIKYIVKNNLEVNKRKLHVLPNWIKVIAYKKPTINYKIKYGLNDKYIAVFGGNLGIPQYIDLILDLSKLYLDIPEIVFLIIGDGTEKNRIKSRIEVESLSNIILKDKIPRNDYIELIKQSDVGLVNLHPIFTIPNIPSRVLAYFQAKIPVLAAIDRNTDFNELIDNTKCGLWCYSDDLISFKNKFDMLFYNKKMRKMMGENGYNYLESNLDVKNIYNIIINEIS